MATRPGGRSVRATVEVHSPSHTRPRRTAERTSRPLSTGPVLVVGYDGGAASADALVLGARLARATDGSVILIAAAPGAGRFARSDWRGRALRLIGRAVEKMDPDRPMEALAVPPGSLLDTSLDVARSEAGSIVVLGEPADGDAGHARRRLDAALHAAPRPVALAPAGYREAAPGALARVGVAFDGWGEARVALAHAVALVRVSGAELCLLMVGDPHTAASREPEADEEASLAGHMHAARHCVDGVVADLPRGLRARGIALNGPVATALTEAARSERLDLLVLGSRRLGPTLRVVLGGVSSALAKQPPCPLLIVPRGLDPPRESAAAGRAGESAW